MKTQRVWSIFYRVRASSASKWCTWVGPCGIFALPQIFHTKITNAMQGRPFFFRTRKQAQAVAKELDEKSNSTWTWTQHIVRPIKLTYEVIE